MAIVRTTFSPMCCCIDISYLIRTHQKEQTRITYSNLKNQLLAIVLGLNGVENSRELLTLEFH